MSATTFECLASASAPVTLTKSVLDALDAPANGVLSIGHIDLIDTFSYENVTACLKLLVEERGSEIKASRGPSDLQ
eukprot:4101897-Pyramimonas_sp.AAC.1